MDCVYILHSLHLDRFYVGYSSDLNSRLEYHKKSASDKFTAKANDWIVFLIIDCVSKEQGLKIEKQIKNMKSKIYIQNLLKYPEMILKLKEKYS